jgi:hypothetical protein
MSIAAKMRPITILSKTSAQSASGQMKEDYRSAGTIKGYIYPTGGTGKTSVNNQKFVESTHMCVTYDDPSAKGITEANRLSLDGLTYEILLVNPPAKLNTILLKKVTYYE